MRRDLGLRPWILLFLSEPRLLTIQFLLFFFPDLGSLRATGGAALLESRVIPRLLPVLVFQITLLRKRLFGVPWVSVWHQLHKGGNLIMRLMAYGDGGGSEATDGRNDPLGSSKLWISITINLGLSPSSYGIYFIVSVWSTCEVDGIRRWRWFRNTLELIQL